MVFSLFQQTAPPRETRVINLRGRRFPVIINRRRNARRMTMRIRDSRISMTMPYSVSDNDISTFINAHQDWIIGQIETHETALAQALPGALADGGSQPMIYYRGHPTRVRLYHDLRREKPGYINHSNDTLSIHLYAKSRMRPAAVLEKHLRHEARRDIQHHLAHYLNLLSEPPAPIAIKDQKTRWGSCSTTRRLSFNWRLIMSPPRSLEYVVAHEAAHLIHHDHSRHFWDKLGEIMPDYNTHQQWLKDHQTVLFADLGYCLDGLCPEKEG